MAGSLDLRRHHNRELGSAVDTVLDGDSPSLDGENAASDRQAHPSTRSACFRICASVKPLEHVWQIGSRNSAAMIADGDRQSIIRDDRFHAYAR